MLIFKSNKLSLIYTLPPKHFSEACLKGTINQSVEPDSKTAPMCLLYFYKSKLVRMSSMPCGQGVRVLATEILTLCQ